MIRAQAFIESARAAGFGLYSGVPCSFLKPFINYVIDSPSLRYVGATNEGDAVAIASGAEIAGTRAVVMFQNSGLGNAVNPLASLNAIFRLPVLVICTLRGDPSGDADEAQHALMGAITGAMLDTMRVPWETFPTDEAQIGSVLERAIGHMNLERTPFALLMKKGSVAPHKLTSVAQARSIPTTHEDTSRFPSQLPSRADVLRALQRETADAAVIATTGFTGRELYAIDDRPNQLYMVGSMGCASSFGLGVALAKPKREVVVVDGDGAALMRLGAMATLGYERPQNLVHVLLDNESHESTGGQSTVSHSIDFAGIARACGYGQVVRATSLDKLAKTVSDARELTFVHVKIRPGAPEDLPRPTITPPEVAERFRRWIA